MKGLSLIFGHTPSDGEMPKGPLGLLLRQCRHAFMFVFVVTVVVEMLSVAPILYMFNMFDRVMSSRSEVTLVSLTLLIVGVYVFWSALEWIRTRLLIRISLRIDWDLAVDVFDASFRRYVGRRKVNVHQVLGDLLTVRQFLTGAPLLALMSTPFAIVFIAIGAVFHPYLAIFAFVINVVLLVATYLTDKVSTPILKEANNALAEANRLAAQSLRLSEPALALGMQASIRKRWYELHQGYLHMQVGASEAAGLTGGAVKFLTNASSSLQMGLGVYLAIQGLITGGMVMAATMLLAKSIQPIQRVLGSWKEITAARQAFERLEEILSEDEVQQDRMSLPPPQGRLQVDNIIVIPPGGNKPVLMGVSFTANPGEAIAMVGTSASGKTSLVKTLVGIWRPFKGSVRLDGAEVADWVHQDLGQYVGYVPQENEFFEGSVAENIARLGDVDPEKVVDAARLAGVHEMILALPKGYDTVLGETGHALTGGQKQRIAFARALYGSPNYIVMDEPNASLDDAGEQALMETIRVLKAAGKTMIFTTHRKGLLAVADRILVLSGGKVTAQGSVNDMIAAVKQRKAQTGPVHLAAVSERAGPGAMPDSKSLLAG